MPKFSECPDKLRIYQFHGLDVSAPSGDQVYTDCPFCGKEGKFSIEVATGLWRCFVCAEGTDKGGGNATVFIRKLYEVCTYSDRDMMGLAGNRRILYPATLRAWGVKQHPLTGEWVLPGYAADGEVVNLYKYVKGKDRTLLLASPDLHAGLFMAHADSFPLSKETVYITEGPWDGMKLWELLRITKLGADGGFNLTSSLESSLAAEADVISVPGATTFADSWLGLLGGKHVILLYDNDHPRLEGNRVIHGAGYTGMKRLAQRLAAADEPPKEITIIKWGEDDYDQS